MVTSGDRTSQARDEAIEQVCGSAHVYGNNISLRLIIRLLKTFALPLLFIVHLELIGIEGWIPAAIAIPGIIVSSYQMFREAIKCRKSTTRISGVNESGRGWAWFDDVGRSTYRRNSCCINCPFGRRALAKAREAMQGGLDRLPRVARRVKEKKSFTVGSIQVGGISAGGSPMTPMNGHQHSGPEQIPIDLLSVGDHIEIRSGELVPADGRIVEGKGALNKAPLTGESVPVDVEEGDFVQAGLVLLAVQSSSKLRLLEKKLSCLN